MKKIINKTASDIFLQHVGMTIAAYAEHEISPVEYPMWAYCDELETYINNGDITASDGTTEYTVPVVAIAFLRS